MLPEEKNRTQPLLVVVSKASCATDICMTRRTATVTYCQERKKSLRGQCSVRGPRALKNVVGCGCVRPLLFM
jgi:hypothetical protein